MFRTPLLLCFLVVSSLDGGIVITREDTAGDTFTNPLGCAAKCPSTAMATITLPCTCECPYKNTWRQDTEDCVQESSCPYSFSSDRILAVTIPSTKVDDKLAPGQGLLYNGANAPKTTGGYLITKFEYLKGNSWTNPSQKEQNYFNFKSQGQSRGQKYILWERIQLQDISSYAGAIIRFTVRPTDINVAPEGCLEIKIAGSLTYVAPTLETQVPAATTSTSSVERTTSYSSNFIGSVPPRSTKAISDLPTLPPIVLEQLGSSDAGAIVGGTIGAVFVTALVFVLIIFLWRKRSSNVTGSGAITVNLPDPVCLGKVAGKAPETVVYERPDETSTADDVVYEEISQGPKVNGFSLTSNIAYIESVQISNEAHTKSQSQLAPNESRYEEPVDNGRTAEHKGYHQNNLIY